MGLPHQPGLDGLRGVALLGVLAFHSQFSWAVGGYLGVSTFFTLSGFLITGLLLGEWRRGERIDVAVFWARRFRRLTPAALLALAGIVLFAVAIGTPNQLAALPGDVLSCLSFATNWWLLTTSYSYAQIFDAPSPVQHFWSLAIEGQFYLVFPFALSGLLAIAGGSRLVIGGVLAALLAGSLATGFILDAAGAETDRIYYGSDTRAAELLLGSLVAVGWRPEPGRAAGRGTRRAWDVLGVGAFVALLWLWSTLPLTSRWLYQGGFGLNAALSAVVMIAAMQRTGPMRALLAWRALRWIGRVSYGGYLYHWPVYLWLSPERTNLGDGPLFALRLAFTLGLAAVSYEFFEKAIRVGGVLRGRTAAAAWLASAALVLAAAFSVSESAPDVAVDLRRSLALPNVPYDQREDGDGPRIAIFGDSVAMQLSGGLANWTTETGDAGFAGMNCTLACGLARNGIIRIKGMDHRQRRICREWEKNWRETLETVRPDLAIVLTGFHDVAPRKLPGDENWRVLGDPVLDEYLRSEMLAAVDLLSSHGALVVWLTHPPMDVKSEPGHAGAVKRFNELVRELAHDRPDTASVVDLGAYVGSRSEMIGTDGVHFAPGKADAIFRAWLGPQLLAAWQAARPKLAL